MDLTNIGFDPSMLMALQDMLDMYEEPVPQATSRTYVRDGKAMAATQADVKEYPNAYVFLVDMPGLKAYKIKVHIEDENVLVVYGERKQDKDEKDKKEMVKYLKIERRFGKFLKRFVLAKNADMDTISSIYQDGVLTVTVEKKYLPETKPRKTIEVRVGK
ncbi:hypothetical protein AAG906_002668 [Vitis piasezkii]